MKSIEFFSSAASAMGKPMSLVRAALRVFCACLVMMAVVPSAALAQSWPQRNVRFIVPLGPGSGSDIGARLFADRLAARWGKPVVEPPRRRRHRGDQRLPRRP